MELQENWTGAVAGTNGLTPAQALEPWEGTQVRPCRPQPSEMQTASVQSMDGLVPSHRFWAMEGQLQFI